MINRDTFKLISKIFEHKIKDKNLSTSEKKAILKMEYDRVIKEQKNDIQRSINRGKKNRTENE